MSFVPFAMERWQSTYEHEVSYNLSESGVHPLDLGALRELVGISPDDLDGLLLEYIQSNGSVGLRSRVAELHPGAAVANVLITTGSAEANFLATWELVGPGANVVFMAPNYFQVHGVAANFGAEVREWRLRPEADWHPDPDELDDLVDGDTAAIVITSPNNPTGAVYGEEFLDAVAAAASRHGTWVISDEVYRGAELDGNESPTLWGRHDRVIVTGGLSKAYGLPGLRVGWAVTTAEMAGRLWARKDYTTISVSALSEHLAGLALAPESRRALLERTRGILRRNWPILEAWLRDRAGTFEWSRPRAGAIAYLRYDLPIDSVELSQRLRRQEDCLLVPGAHFGMPEYLRIGIGPEEDRFRGGLQRLARVVDPLREPRGRPDPAGAARRERQ